MIIKIDREDAESLKVDQTGTAQEPGGPQGFQIFIGGLCLEFEDERDAERMAFLIAERNGVTCHSGPCKG